MVTSIFYARGTIAWCEDSQVWQVTRPREVAWSQKSTRIVQTPGVLGGKPRIAGRRVAVQHVVVWHDQIGMSIGEIAREYDLTLPEIRAALEYYADHRTEIDEAIQAEQAFIAEMRQRHPSKLASNLKLRSGD